MLHDSLSEGRRSFLHEQAALSSCDDDDAAPGSGPSFPSAPNPSACMPQAAHWYRNQDQREDMGVEGTNLGQLPWLL